MSERVTPSLPAERSPDNVRADRTTLVEELLTVFERHAGEVDDADLAAAFFEISEAIARNRCVDVTVGDTDLRGDGFDHDDAGVIRLGDREIIVGAPQWLLCPQCDNAAEHAEEKWPADELADTFRRRVADE
jgi:hypothetical protein